MRQTTAAAFAAPSILAMAAMGQRSIRFNTPPQDPPPAKPPVEPKPEPKKHELTDEEIEAIVEKRLKAERDAQEAARKKEEEEKAAEEARRKGEFEKLAADEKAKREKAEAEAAEANRRAQLAEVNIKLRDYLAEKHPDYLANAADIMLHVEKQLKPDAKPEDVAKLIAEQAKAFVERTPKAKVATVPAPTRTGVPGGANVPPSNPNPNNGSRVITPASRF